MDKVTLAWFETCDEHLDCIGCDQERSHGNSLFCHDCYNAFIASPVFSQATEANDGDEKAWRPRWVKWANERRRSLSPLLLCLCGAERDDDDYLCPDCRSSKNSAISQ